MQTNCNDLSPTKYLSVGKENFNRDRFNSVYYQNITAHKIFSNNTFLTLQASEGYVTKNYVVYLYLHD